MRLINFCARMGFALFVAVILAVFVHNVPLAVLYVIGHLIWAFFSDRQTVYGEKHKKSLAEKYPAYSMPDTQYFYQLKLSYAKVLKRLQKGGKIT